MPRVAAQFADGGQNPVAVPGDVGAVEVGGQHGVAARCVSAGLGSSVVVESGPAVKDDDRPSLVGGIRRTDEHTVQHCIGIVIGEGLLEQTTSHSRKILTEFLDNSIAIEIKQPPIGERIRPALVAWDWGTLTAGGSVDEFVGGFGPREGLAALVPALDVGVDRGGELIDAAVAAAADGLPGDDREEDLDQVEPGPRGRGEMKGDPGLRASQARTAGCLWVA